jgi:UDP-N-acetylmuramoyl-L-alanyl-D-glutamate--2,6-diaminopimelate ligase
MLLDKIFYKIKKIIPMSIFKKIQPIYHWIISFLAYLIYSNPSQEIIVIGITGTTGKTTTTYLIAKMLENNGFKVGFTSTALFNNGKKEWLNNKKMTMLGRFFTQKILRQMVKNGCQYAIIETTSEGIRQYRHQFINYDLLVFTGLYPEHIESHGSFENYKKTKQKLFQHLEKCFFKYVDEQKKVIKIQNNLKKLDLNKIKKTIIVNGNDEHYQDFIKFWAEDKIIVNINQENNQIKEKDFIKKIIVQDQDIIVNQKGLSFNVFTENESEKFNLQLLGKFNVHNILSVIAIGLNQGLSLLQIENGLEKISGIPGRLEKINQGQNFTIIVDYAFEPVAVSKLYETIKSIPYNKIIHVLGSAGGGRDKARRPELGKIAGKNADYVIITNEDPYDEDPQEIIEQIFIGAEQMNKIENKNLFKIIDRHQAIEKALSLANPNDIVLITGKGSEQSICIANNEKIPFDDREVVKNLINLKK